MIIDSADNLALYAELNPRFARVADYLATANLDTLSHGKYPIDGERIFISVMENGSLKKAGDAPLEAHRSYIDIQIVIRGRESYGWRALAQCLAPRGEMDRERDILFYDDEPALWFTLEPGSMAIFLPGDAHAPMVGEGIVKKAIVKVLV
ncbi:sugar isomerase [Bacteroidia bacterium]|nr:sugar isomerase [Bacteroidia bacterium]